MTLSSKSVNDIADALTPEVINSIQENEDWVDFMMETIPDILEEKLGKIQMDVMMDLTMCIMDRITLRQSKL